MLSVRGHIFSTRRFVFMEAYVLLLSVLVFWRSPIILPREDLSKNIVERKLFKDLLIWPLTPCMMPGYAKEILSNQRDLNDTLLCCICHLVLRSAVQSTCGHRYCETCVKDKIARNSDPNVTVCCPACPPGSEDAILNEKEIYPDFHARKELKPLKCKCPNEGCPWGGNYAQYVEHEPICDLAPVTCHEPGCGKPLRRGDVNYHLDKDCPMRKVKCRHCGEILPYMNMKKHNSECPKMKVNCPNCQTKMAREKLQSHQDFDIGDCPKKEKPCPFNTMGCETKVTESDISQHLQNEAPYHAELQIGIFQGWVNKVEELLSKFKPHQGSISNATVGETVTDAEPLELSTCAGAAAGPDILAKTKDVYVSQSMIDQLVSAMKGIFILRAENDTKSLKPDKMTNNHSKSGRALNAEKKINELDGKFREKEQELENLKTLYAVLDKRNETFQEVVAVLNNQLEALAEKINNLERQNRHLQDTIEQQERQIHAHDQMLTVKNVALAEQELRIQSLESSAYNGILVWKISEYSRRRRDAVSGKTTSFYSPAFYTSYHGYKMCARIYLNGDGMGKGTHVSLFFVVMKGRYDNILRWPFRQKVTFMMVDQGNREHVVDAFRPDPTSSSFKKPTHEMNIASGCPLFVSLSLLENGNYSYVKDDCLFVKVVVDVSDLERI